ncbi:MAG: glycosyltransferase family 4 protein [Gammaproteobacteria bacterium]
MKPRRAVILCFYGDPTPRQQNLFRLFREIGCEPAYVTWDRSCGRPPSGRSREEDLAVIRLAAPTESARLLFVLPEYWRKLGSALHRVIQEDSQAPIIVATHFCHLPLARRFPRATWLYDAAEYYAYDLSRYFGWLANLIQPLFVYLEGRGMRRMGAVLAVDSRAGWFERQISRYNRSVRVIPNVPALADDPPTEWVQRAATRYGDRRVICYVGGIMERKGLQAALRTVEIIRKDIPNILLLLIGAYRGGHDALAGIVRDGQLSEHVSIIDQRPYREMLAEISRAEVGLALHQRDALYEKVGAMNGRKIFTYMQAGLAVVAPQFGDLGRVVREVNCGILVNTDSTDDIVAAICKLLSDRPLQIHLKSNGRRAFEQFYNWEVVARDLKPWLRERTQPSPST